MANYPLAQLAPMKNRSTEIDHLCNPPRNRSIKMPKYTYKLSLLISFLTIGPSSMAQIDPSIPLRAMNIPPIQPPKIESPIEVHMRLERLRQQQLQNRQLELELQRQTEERRREQERRAIEANNSQPSPAPRSQELHPAVEDWLRAAAPRMGLYADFEKVVFAPDLAITHDMLRLMSPREYAADIAYYLGQNKMESLAISKLNLVEAARAIDGIEQRLISRGIK
jgi:hypothetical protein